MEIQPTSIREELAIARLRALSDLDAYRWVSRAVGGVPILLLFVGLAVLLPIAATAAAGTGLHAGASIAAAGAACRLMRELRVATTRFLRAERRFICAINRVRTSKTAAGIQRALRDYSRGEGRGA